MDNIKRKHKYEIQIYEADYDKADFRGGRPEWRPIARGLDNGRPVIIEAADENELNEFRKQYAMCDQRFEIIREIDPFISAKNVKVDDAKTDAKIDAKIDIDKAVKSIVDDSIDESNESKDESKDEASLSDVKKTNTPAKPKIITVGDVQIKYDGNKVYQRQWVKLNANEAANFRIVNDSNNKIVNLTNKHIEARKWVIIEESASVDDDSTFDGDI